MILSLIFMLFSGPNAEAKHCVVGKACGNSCISTNDVCHIGLGSGIASGSTRATEMPVKRSHIRKTAKHRMRKAHSNDVVSGATRDDEYTAKRHVRRHRHGHKKY